MNHLERFEKYSNNHTVEWYGFSNLKRFCLNMNCSDCVLCKYGLNVDCDAISYKELEEIKNKYPEFFI